MTTDTSAAGARLQFHGKGGELFVTYLINIVLKILTLGVYHFWAKTRVRRYLWTQTSFDGEHFEYTGTGMELLMGFLKVLGIAILIGIVVSVFSAFFPTVAMVIGVIALFFLPFLMPVVIGAGLYGAARYKLTRTKLRSIRFGLKGSAWEHGFMTLGYGLLVGLTLTLYSPFARMKLAAHTVNNTRFGDRAFKFTGTGSDLFGSYLIALLLLIPTLGLAWFWYMGKEMRYRAEHTEIEGMRFKVTVTGGELLLFWLGTLLALLFTLGLAFPWVVCRFGRFMAERTHIEGSLDYDTILQSQRASGTTAEGLVEALDLGVI